MDALAPVLTFLAAAPWLSHMLFGALGGLVYILRQKTRNYLVRPVEWLARPIIGAAAAWIITIALGLPNHLTSLFVGYFGIDIWDAVSSRFEKELPLAFDHVDFQQVVIDRVAQLEKTAAPAVVPDVAASAPVAPSEPDTPGQGGGGAK